jgi:hypothetical protein
MIGAANINYRRIRACTGDESVSKTWQSRSRQKGRLRHRRGWSTRLQGRQRGRLRHSERSRRLKEIFCIPTSISGLMAKWSGRRWFPSLQGDQKMIDENIANTHTTIADILRSSISSTRSYWREADSDLCTNFDIISARGTPNLLRRFWTDTFHSYEHEVSSYLGHRHQPPHWVGWKV